MATDEQIKTAFNAGYDMQQFDPPMVEKLVATDTNNEIVQALTQGAKQSKKEKIARQQKEIKERNQIKSHQRK